MSPFLVAALVACRGGTVTESTLPHTHRALVDDLRMVGPNGEDLGRSRLDTARSYFGNVNVDGPRPILNAGSGDNGAVRYAWPRQPGQTEGLPLDQLLGPTLVYDIQPTVAGLDVQVGGSGALEARLLAPDGTVVWSQIQSMSQRADTVTFDLSDANPVTRVNALELGLVRGFAEVRRVDLLLQERRPYTDTVEEAFVFSYSQLSRCWDAARGLVRDRCTLDDAPAYRPDATGLFALATAVGADLGYVSEDVARSIVTDARAALLALPRGPITGLWPDRTDGTGLPPDGQFSSLSTAVAAQATALAATALALDADTLLGVLEDVAWDELTVNGGLPISAGFDDRGVANDWRFGVFGSKAVLLQIAHQGATGTLAPMDLPFTPTWDGAGWDNELAALLFPMTGTDVFGNDWTAWRSGAHWQHHTWSRDTPAGELAWFGLSTAEVPEPWGLESFAPTVGDFGVGGHNAFGTDGFDTVGYSFYAPHYAALVVTEHPDTAGAMLQSLLDRDLLTPLNAVESVGVADGGVVRFNHRLRSFTLALQALGLGRALSGDGYLPYRVLDTIPFLRDAHRTMLPETAP